MFTSTKERKSFESIEAQAQYDKMLTNKMQKEINKSENYGEILSIIQKYYEIRHFK